MSRYAIVIKDTGEVSDIKEMAGDSKPEINKDTAGRYEVVEVGPDVKVGMIRGGTVDAAGGFGFVDELSAAGKSGDRPKKKEADDASLPASTHEKVRADSPEAKEAASEQKSASPARPDAGKTGQQARPETRAADRDTARKGA